MDALARRDLRELERLLERPAELAEPRDVRDHVGLFVYAVKVDQRLRQARVRPAHLMEHVTAPAKPVRGLAELEGVAPEVVRRSRLGIELVPIELTLELRNAVAHPGTLCLAGGLRHVVDAVVVVLAPECRLRERAEVESLLEARIEPLVQAGAFTGD